MKRIKISKPALFAFFLIAAVFTGNSQTITPVQTDEIIIDNGTPGKADPADRIRYKVTIQNTGGASGNGTQLNIVPDPRTTFVPGTFRSSPLAVPDAYTCTGNVGINVPAASGLLSNDFDDNIAGLTITAGTFATTGGGSIMIAADGSFMYSPPAGLTGGMTDTYTYTLNDGNGVGAGVPATDLGLVTFTLNNLIWFVDNTGGGSGGNGTLASPFKTLTDFNAGSTVAADVIYIEHTGTNYAGGIVLANNEHLFGEGHTGGANLANVLPFSLAPNSKPLPNINGLRPVVTNAAGDGVTLAMHNTLRGFDVGNCSDFGMENSGTNSVGNLVISEVNINNTTGGGFDASHGSGASTSIVFGSLSSTGGANGINLSNCAGSFTVNGGTITNPTGTGVLISGGSVAFSSSGAVTDNSGFAVEIDNHDSGNATFSGNITSTGTGIRVQNCGGGTKTFSGSSKNLTTTTNTAVTLSGNTGATINLTGGGLVITTTSGTGFLATGGGTVSVQGTGNNIVTSAAKAIELSGVSSNVTFNTINAAAVPTEGINLSNLTNGSIFKVGMVDVSMATAGNANVNISNCPNATIDIGMNVNTPASVNLNNRRSSGIILNNSSGTIRFGNVTANNPNSVTVPAIKSTGCAGAISFAKTDIDMNNAGGNEGFTNAETPQDNSGDGDAIYVSGFTGTAFSISGGTIQKSGDDGIDFRASANLTLNNVTIIDVGKSPAAGCVDCNSSGVQAYNATGVATISNCIFERGRLRNFYLSNTTGSGTLNITNSLFNDTRSQGSPATDNLQVYGTGTATLAIDIENSTFTRSRTKQIDVVFKGNSILTKCDITGSTTDYVDGPSAGIFIEGFDNAQVNFNIMDNPKLHSQDENVVTISTSGAASVQGRIKNNPNMKFYTPSMGGSSFGVARVVSDGTTSVATVLVENNSMVLDNGTDGINLSVQLAGAAKINATLNANTIHAMGVAGIPLDAINAFVNPTVGGTKQLCLTYNDNVVTGIWTRALRVRALSPTGVTITNFVTDVATTWTNNGNTGGPVVQSTSAGGTISAAPQPCALPTNPLP